MPKYSHKYINLGFHLKINQNFKILYKRSQRRNSNENREKEKVYQEDLRKEPNQSFHQKTVRTTLMTQKLCVS